MSPALDPTCFAPSERAGSDEIQRQFVLVARHEIPAVLNAMPIISMVLNRYRQVVFGNTKFLEAVGVSDIREILGQRPGEAFGCVHAAKAPGGCGTGEFCVHCGAVRSILLGLAGRENIQDCNINRDAGEKIEALDLQVSSSPLSLENEPFVIFSITDVSHENRRRALERIFFHDVLNTAGGIRTLASFLVEDAPDALQADAQLIYRNVGRLIDEILYQKQLLAAESNELEVHAVPLRAGAVLKEVEDAFQNSDQGQDKRIEVRNACDALALHCDPVLLRRVLGNMVKNALEATAPGGLVRLGCQPGDGGVEFWVQNDAVIPGSVRLRIFNRSFSTKGVGRGLGTYSIKLLTERYLGGSVDFTSTPTEGTIFRVALPLGTPA